jgi:hypothetical protein
MIVPLGRKSKVKIHKFDENLKLLEESEEFLEDITEFEEIENETAISHEGGTNSFDDSSEFETNPELEFSTSEPEESFDGDLRKEMEKMASDASQVDLFRLKDGRVFVYQVGCLYHKRDETKCFLFDEETKKFEYFVCRGVIRKVNKMFDDEENNRILLQTSFETDLDLKLIVLNRKSHLN